VKRRHGRDKAPSLVREGLLRHRNWRRKQLATVGQDCRSDTFGLVYSALFMNYVCVWVWYFYIFIAPKTVSKTEQQIQSKGC
jgi:hypothetical protein